MKGKQSRESRPIGNERWCQMLPAKIPGDGQRRCALLATTRNRGREGGWGLGRETGDAGFLPGVVALLVAAAGRDAVPGAFVAGIAPDGGLQDADADFVCWFGHDGSLLLLGFRPRSSGPYGSDQTDAEPGTCPRKHGAPRVRCNLRNGRFTLWKNIFVKAVSLVATDGCGCRFARVWPQCAGTDRKSGDGISGRRHTATLAAMPLHPGAATGDRASAAGGCPRCTPAAASTIDDINAGPAGLGTRKSRHEIGQDAVAAAMSRSAAGPGNRSQGRTDREWGRHEAAISLPQPHRDNRPTIASLCGVPEGIGRDYKRPGPCPVHCGQAAVRSRQHESHAHSR